MSGRSQSYAEYNKIRDMIEPQEPAEEGAAGKLSAAAQKLLGDIEMIGGVLTADPITQAEGQYNVAAGELREDIEEDLDEGERP